MLQNQSKANWILSTSHIISVTIIAEVVFIVLVFDVLGGKEYS